MLQYPDSFLEYISSGRRYSERTVLLYRSALYRFYASIVRSGDKLPVTAEDVEATIEGAISELSAPAQISLLTSTNIRSFIALSLKDGMSPRSVNLMISALSSYCKWLVREEKLGVWGYTLPLALRKLCWVRYTGFTWFPAQALK